MMLRNILILSSIVCTVTAVCMDDWVRHADSCYYFAHLPSMRVTWHRAVQDCFRNESQLVIVDTKEENDFIKRHLAELNPERDEQFWTFGNDIYTEGVWNWGEKVNPISNATSFWHPGEPNQYHNVEEDCLAFMTTFNFDWNDGRCDLPQYYICETTDFDVGGIIG